MAKGVNKVILIGRLGQDPETRYTASGAAITNISLATSESWKDKQTGQMQEKTEWHRVCFFNRLAEIAGEYLRKGSNAYIEGKLQTRKWQDQQGQDRYTTEVVANELQMLDSRQEGQQSNSRQPQQAPQQYANSPQQQTRQPAPAPQQQAQPAPAPEMDSFDDDIPF